MFQSFLSFLLAFSFLTIGKSQILIGGQIGNTIYSSISNTIEYTGQENCKGLIAKIEGFDEELEFIGCTIDIMYLPLDTSKFQILNLADEVIFDTILIKNKNEPIAYIQIGGRSISSGSINKDDFQLLQELRVIYDCPWLDNAQVIKYALVVTSKDGNSAFIEVNGSQVPRVFIEEICLLRNPTKLYVENIHWKSIKCSSHVSSIQLNIH